MTYVPSTHTDEPAVTLNEPDYAGSYTAADFIQWTFRGFYELIRGKVYKMSAPLTKHQEVVGDAYLALRSHFKGTDCRVFVSPYAVFLVNPGDEEPYLKTKNVLEPDLCVVCDPCKIRRRGCVGAPDLVVEVLSPSTSHRDLNDKLALYEEYGVPELWIIHPLEETIIAHILKEGSYEPQRILGRTQSLQSHLFPELVINLSDIFSGIEYED